MPETVPPIDSCSRHCSAWAVTFLLAISVIVLFPSLGRPAMEPDESLYALATDQIRATGEWWTLSPQPPSPYFNKPPLYMWLSALTYDLLPGFEFRYRFWSAVFGVVAVAMTGLLAARMFNWPVGLVAALLLLTNRSFLTDHGARFGGMDAGLTACMATILWLYWTDLVGRSSCGWHGQAYSLARGDRRPTFATGNGLTLPMPPGASDYEGSRRMWPTWVAIGIVAGVASLLKPLGGLPILGLLGVHALASPVDGQPRKPVELRRLVAMIALTLGCMIAVAAPWYIVNHVRYPDDFARLLFSGQIEQAIVGQNVDGDVTKLGWAFYIVRITTSSTHFALAIPAALWVAFRPFPPDRSWRAKCLLLTFTGLCLITVLSITQKKFLHYAYPAFVPLTIAMAVMLFEILGWLGRRLQRESLAGRAMSAVIVILALFAGWLGLHRLTKMSDPSPIWSVYQQWRPALQSGRARLVFVDMPREPGQSMPDGRPARPHVMIYLSHMRPAEWAATTELAQSAATDQPTLLVLPAGQSGLVIGGQVLIEEKWLSVVGVNADTSSVNR